MRPPFGDRQRGVFVQELVQIKTQNPAWKPASAMLLQWMLNFI
ncbi:hypothetical protein [Leptolyngbya sp. NM3-A1]